MLGSSWKLYAGKFLETICWKIRVDTGCFLKGVIMAQYAMVSYYGFKAIVPGVQLSIPAAETFLLE